MKYFKFSIEQKCIGLGYVYAETKEEAREKILKEEYDDIYDTVSYEDGEIIDIEDGVED